MKELNIDNLPALSESYKGMIWMATNTSVSLGDQSTEFVDHQIQSGLYDSVSEVVREGLRLLEER